jgi:hexosaminidase
MKLASRLFQFVLLSFVMAALFTSCKEKEAPTDLAKETIIPKPVSVTTTGKSFSLTAETIIYVAAGNDELLSVAQRLASQINSFTGFTNKIEVSAVVPETGLYLSIVGDDKELGEEGYELIITEDLIKLQANTPAGIFLGVQTLAQLVPIQGETSGYQGRIATGTIRDYPTYAWRGSMLDVARHFFSVEDVKRYIDLISYYKMNVLHLHLSDDQGWRIEIKSWPNLTAHGGSTQVGGGKGGFYTQEQYKDIVAYAQSRYITVVPEIDLPGHINSALASYGELNFGIKVPVEGIYNGPLSSAGILDGKQKPTELYTGIEVGWSTLQYGKPSTTKFLNDVIREISENTPGSYVHIGGDEAHATKKEDYIKFVNQFMDIVKANGKQMIGWEEIAQGNIDGNAIAQHWASEKYAQMAAEKGARIIMSPSTRVYLDMQYDSTTRIGLHWAAYIEVDDAYDWNPATQVDGISKDQIMGVETPLWSETIENMNDIEYLLFPRLPGIAEIGWSPTEGRSWDEYKVRLGNHGPRMKALGIDFYPSAKVPWVD